MTVEETKKLLAVISGLYPNFKPESKEVAVLSWHMMLEDFNYSEINMALKTYATTSKSAFAPSVSELIALTYKPGEVNELSESEASALVYKAICNSAYNSVSEYNKLPAAVQKAVGSPEQLKIWAITSDLNWEVVSSNLQRAYRNIISKEKEYALLPQELKAMLPERINQ